MEKSMCFSCYPETCNCKKTDSDSSDDPLVSSFVKVNVDELSQSPKLIPNKSVSQAKMEALLEDAARTTITCRRDVLAKDEETDAKTKQTSMEALLEDAARTTITCRKDVLAKDAKTKPSSPQKVSNVKVEAASAPIPPKSKLYFGTGAGAKKKTTNKTCKSPPKTVPKKEDSPEEKTKRDSSKKLSSPSSTETSKLSAKNEKKAGSSTKSKVKKNNDFECEEEKDDFFLGMSSQERKRLYEKFLTIWCTINPEEYKTDKHSFDFTLTVLNIDRNLQISKETLEEICKSRGTSFWSKDAENSYENDSLSLFKKRVLHMIRYKDRMNAERAGGASEVREEEAQAKKRASFEPEPQMFDMELDEPSHSRQRKESPPLVKPIPVRPKPKPANVLFKGTSFDYGDISGLYDKRGNLYYNQGPERVGKKQKAIGTMPSYRKEDYEEEYLFPTQVSLREISDGANYAVIIKEDGKPNHTFASAFYRVPKFPITMSMKEKQMAMFHIIKTGERRVAMLYSPPPPPPMEVPTEADVMNEVQKVFPDVSGSPPESEEPELHLPNLLVELAETGRNPFPWKSDLPAVDRSKYPSARNVGKTKKTSPGKAEKKSEKSPKKRNSAEGAQALENIENTPPRNGSSPQKSPRNPGK